MFVHPALPSTTENKHTLATHTRTQWVVMALIVTWNSHSPRPRANRKTQQQQMFDEEQVRHVLELVGWGGGGVGHVSYGSHGCACFLFV